MHLEPLTSGTKLEVGDIIIFDKGDGLRSSKKIKAITYEIDKPIDIILNLKKNRYFILNQYLHGTSWVKNAHVVRG